MNRSLVLLIPPFVPHPALTSGQVLKDVARIIYSVHDDVKDKDFELELSWVCEESGWVHKQV